MIEWITPVPKEVYSDLNDRYYYVKLPKGTAKKFKTLYEKSWIADSRCISYADVFGFVWILETDYLVHYVSGIGTFTNENKKQVYEELCEKYPLFKALGNEEEAKEATILTELKSEV